MKSSFLVLTVSFLLSVSHLKAGFDIEEILKLSPEEAGHSLQKRQLKLEKIISTKKHKDLLQIPGYSEAREEQIKALTSAFKTLNAKEQSEQIEESIQLYNKAKNKIIRSKTLLKQVKKVESFITERKGVELPVKLVFGERNTETKLHSDESWIYFDEFEHDPSGRPHIQGNFNDVELLQFLATRLGRSLDEAVFSDATSKFMIWNSNHLRALVALLKETGQFIFNPANTPDQAYKGTPLYDRGDILKEAKVLNVADYSLDALPRYVKLPKIGVTVEEKEDPVFLEKFKELTDKYREMMPYSPQSVGEENFKERAFLLKLRELALPSINALYLDDHELWKQSLIEGSKKENILNAVYREVHIPQTVRVFEQFFNEIEVQEDVPYPIPTAWDRGGQIKYTIVKAKYPKL
ncbi:MAG: hypothetical protein BGO67_09935 [Alphaproteobacteria bacterium 41-28]|nr:MAG: hypothetical protein BGO67_09935 [Alphaproteobacteria bacterium 41-28]